MEGQVSIFKPLFSGLGKHVTTIDDAEHACQLDTIGPHTPNVAGECQTYLSY